MFLVRFAALTAAALAVSGAAANAGGPLRPFHHGFWAGGAYTDERTGAFTHCSAGVAYDSGVDLFVLVTGHYRWWLGFINPKWSFTPNTKTLIKLSLDAGAPLDRVATVPNGQLLLIPLPDNSHLIDTFRNAAELTLDAGEQPLFFKLNETPGMMDRLTACVRTSLAIEDEGRPDGSRSAATSASPAAPTKAAASGSSPPPSAGAPSEASAVSRLAAPPAVSSNTLQKSSELAITNRKAAFSTVERNPGNKPAASATAPAAAVPLSATGQQNAATKNTGTLRPPTSPANAVPAVAKTASAANLTAAAVEVSPTKAAVPQTAPIASSERVASLLPHADGAAQSPHGGARASITAPSPAAATAETIKLKPQTPEPTAGRPPLAFTAVTPTPSPLLPSFGPEPGGVLEEIRLATEFLSNARLPDAHLVVADKPRALANFAAVWRSDDAAGAVKIIPAGPDVSAVGIASNLIAVDPELCKGDFSSARFHTDVGNRTVFSAVLSCSEANEERVTEYLIAPRQQGGFVVFAVIRSKDGGQALDLDRQNLEGLSRAAIQTVAGQG
jgi:hypothetical protein